MRISPRFTIADWNACFTGQADRETAIEIVKDRIEGGWLKWADQICGVRHSGFAVLALDVAERASLGPSVSGAARQFRQSNIPTSAPLPAAPAADWRFYSGWKFPVSNQTIRL